MISPQLPSRMTMDPLQQEKNVWYERNQQLLQLKKGWHMWKEYLLNCETMFFLIELKPFRITKNEIPKMVKMPASTNNLPQNVPGHVGSRQQQFPHIFPQQGGYQTQQQKKKSPNTIKNYNNDNYCYYCGFDIAYWHNSSTCNNKKYKHTSECNNSNRYNFQMFPGTSNSGQHKYCQVTKQVNQHQGHYQHNQLQQGYTWRHRWELPGN